MAPKGFNYLLLTAVVVLLIVVQSPAAEARQNDGVNPFCRTADHLRICNNMVNGASNWHDATANAIKSALAVAKKLSRKFPSVMPAVADLSATSRDEITQLCKDDFDGIVDDLETSLDALNSGDIGTASAHLSGALRTDCEDALSDSGADFPLTKVAGHLTRQVENCLAVLLQD